MLFKSIDFPPEVVQAQKDGKLVIFAGAGVSMAPPSNLPSFSGLVEMIGAGVPKRREETEDQYLGRLHEDGQGVRVHDIAAQILLRPESKPTNLHSLLLRLFHPKRPVRIVTTNFDSHFSSASNELGFPKLETFCGPALPVGDDFEGLVYLHGSAAIAPNKMVLTDRDFGRAYLTYGWASRFLYHLFSEYTVLFVGYSHSDVVMRYLNRGLPPQSNVRRFAFSEVNRQLDWKDYGIKPLVYEPKAEDDPHGAIADSIAEWVDEIHRGLLARSERIRSIVEAIPPLQGEDADYLKYALLAVDTARQFVKFARLPDYLEWLERHGFLKAVFDPRAKLTYVDQELILWIASHMLAEHPQRVLALVHRHGQILHPEFCWRIHWRIAYRRNDPGVDAIFRTWISILISQPYTSLSREDWSYLLSQCQWPDDKDAAILLFEFITRPRVVLREAWSFATKTSGEEIPELVDYEIDLEGETDHWLSTHWTAFFKPHLFDLSKALLPIVTCHIQSAHALLRLNQRADSKYDRLSMGREEIKHGGLYPGIFDKLVDAARDLIAVALANDSREGRSVVDRWFNSEVPILKRLAVYGIAVDATLSADDKMQWMIDHSLLFQTGFKPETFEVLRTGYPNAAKEVRRRIVSAVLLGRQAGEMGNLSERSRAYEIYNLLVWLTQVAPDCDIAREALDSTSSAHPDFSPRPHPNINFSFSSWSEVPRAKFNFDEILQKPAKTFLDELLATPREAALGDRREDFTNALMGLVTKSPGWGFDLQSELISRQIFDQEIWAQVFNGWRETKMTADQWQKWLDTIDAFPTLDFCADEIAEVLYAQSSRKEDSIPQSLMDRAYGVSQRAWNSMPDRGETPRDNDWLSLAINRGAGKVAQFWLEYLSALRGQAADQWKGIPSSVQVSLIKVVDGDSSSAALAGVIIASQFHYLFYLDPKFARNHLLCLFDWKANDLRAVRAWQGFLAWGRWQRSYLDEMLPYYAQTVPHLTEFPPHLRESFAEHIAGIAVFGKTDALADSWLLSIMQGFTPELRGHFSEAILKVLEDLETDATADVWNRWLRRYWDERRLGRPALLDQAELNRMARWAVHLGNVFPEVVNLLAKSPKFDQKYPLTDEELEKIRPLGATFPESMADYLIIVLRGLKQLYDKKPLELIIADLETNGVGAQKLTSLRDELLRLR